MREACVRSDVIHHGSGSMKPVRPRLSRISSTQTRFVPSPHPCALPATEMAARDWRSRADRRGRLFLVSHESAGIALKHHPGDRPPLATIVCLGRSSIDALSTLRLRIAPTGKAYDGHFSAHRQTQRSPHCDVVLSTFTDPFVISRRQTLGCDWTIQDSMI